MWRAQADVEPGAGGVSRRTVLGQLSGLAACAGLASACRMAPPSTATPSPPPGPLALDALELVADGLSAPEGIVIARDGRVFVSSDKAACVLIEPGGTTRLIGEAPAATGLAMDRQGRIIIANVGLLKGTSGPLQRLDPATGTVEMLAEGIDGRALVASNWPAIGPDGIYCTHSTWADVANIGTTDPAGFVYRVGEDGAVAKVVDGIRGANGCCFDADFGHLYVAQTAAGDVLRFTRQPDGSYGAREPWGPRLGLAPDNLRAGDIIGKMSAAERSALGHPDGIALDAAGNLWATLPFANRIVAITPAGEKIDILSDPEGKSIQLPTSIAWGGADLRELHIVSRRNGRLWKIRTAIPGLALPHWSGAEQRVQLSHPSLRAGRGS